MRARFGMSGFGASAMVIGAMFVVSTASAQPAKAPAAAELDGAEVRPFGDADGPERLSRRESRRADVRLDARVRVVGLQLDGKRAVLSRGCSSKRSVALASVAHPLQGEGIDRSACERHDLRVCDRLAGCVEDAAQDPLTGALRLHACLGRFDGSGIRHGRRHAAGRNGG